MQKHLRKAVVICVASRGFDELWRFCIESHQHYCDRFGYKYHLLTNDNFSPLEPHWQKLQLAEYYLQTGYDVLLLDADTYITEHTPNFLKTLDRLPEKDIFAALGQSNRPNSGVVLFRGREQSVAIDFLQQCLENQTMPVPEEHFVTAHGENGHFIHFLTAAPFTDRFQLLSSAWNRTSLPIKRSDYIIHFTGQLREWSENAVAPKQLLGAFLSA